MRHRHFIGLLLIITTLTAYWQVCGFNFVILDDNKNVYENPYLNPVTPSKILHFWKAPYQKLYIPFTYTIWAVGAGISQIISNVDPNAKLHPRIFHTINLFFHISSTLLIYMILRLLHNTQASNLNSKFEVLNPHLIDWAAGIGALFFAIHPIQVEAVAWVTGMKDLLCGLLSLTAIWQYILCTTSTKKSFDIKKNSISIENKFNKRKEKKKKKTYIFSNDPINTPQSFNSILQSVIYNPNYIFASLAFLLALLSKPAAIIVPLIALILDYCLLKRPLRNTLIPMIVWMLIAIPFMILTKMSQPAVTINAITSLLSRPIVAVDALAFYLYKLILPIWLGPDYGRSPMYIFQNRWIYFTWLAPCGLGVLVWLRKDCLPQWLLASLGIFVVGVLPVLGFIPFEFQYMSTVADRYLYLSMLGVATAVSWVFIYYRNKLITTGCILILFLMGILTRHQTQYWRNTTALLEHAIEINLKSGLAHNNLGIAIAEQGKNKEAFIHYKKALLINPDDYWAHNNIAILLDKQGKLYEAIEHYSEALKINPNYPKTHNNLGLILFKQGKIDEAIIHYSEAMRLDPNYKTAHYNMGNALEKQGKIKKATYHYNEELQINPNNAHAHYRLGLILFEQEKLTDAIFHYSEALRIKPNLAEACNNLGNIFKKQGNIDEAVNYYSKALRIKPDFAEVHYNIGIMYSRQGKLDMAIKHYNEALRFKPTLVVVYNNLGIALSQIGKIDEAVEAFQKALQATQNNVMAYNNLGNVLADQGKLNEAIEEFSKALQIKPNLVEAHNGIGIALARQGRLDEAISHFSEALRIQPGNKQASNNLGIALQKQRR